MALFAGGQADLPGASSDFGTPAGNPWVLPCFTPKKEAVRMRLYPHIPGLDELGTANEICPG